MKSLLGKLGVILVGLAIFSYAEAWADEEERRTLRGLKGVYVSIADLTPESGEIGLTQDQLRTDVELRLRKAGIKVLTQQDFYSAKGKPYLLISVGCKKGEVGTRVGNRVYPYKFYALSMMVFLYQNVLLERSPNINVSGATWTGASFGWSSKDNMRNFIKNGLGDIVERFMNDYLAENQK